MTQPDPLTCNRVELFSLIRGTLRDDCDCCAPDGAYHRETCSVTPVYAAVVDELGSWRDAANDLTFEFRDFVQLSGRVDMIESSPLWTA